MAGQKLPPKPAPRGRQPDSAPLIGDPDWWEYPALWCPGPYRRRMIPMPRGRGARWLVECPRCRRWVKTLYRPDGADLTDRWCRHCWGLRYPSQYSGRHPECDPDRMTRLLDSALRAKKRGNEELAHKRASRFLEAMDTYQTRTAAYQLAEMQQGWAELERDLQRIGRQEAEWKRKHTKRKRGQQTASDNS